MFYSNDDSSDLSVVMRAPPRGYHELEIEEEFAAAPVFVDESEDLGMIILTMRDFVVGMIVRGS